MQCPVITEEMLTETQFLKMPAQTARFASASITPPAPSRTAAGVTRFTIKPMFQVTRFESQNDANENQTIAGSRTHRERHVRFLDMGARSPAQTRTTL